MCAPMFITALFIIARTWKQPRCPSVDEWIRKLWYTYTMNYYSAIEMNCTVLSSTVCIFSINLAIVFQERKVMFILVTFKSFTDK